MFRLAAECESLDEGNRAGVACGAFQACLVQPSHELRGERRATPCAGGLATKSGSILDMHRVLATLIATALLIGCSEQPQVVVVQPKGAVSQSAQQSTPPRAAYLASAEAHAAAVAAAQAAFWAAPSDNAITRTAGAFWIAASRAAAAAVAAADAVGSGNFYPAVREADAAAASAWKDTQIYAERMFKDPELGRVLGEAFEAARKAWEAAERAKASHD